MGDFSLTDEGREALKRLDRDAAAAAFAQALEEDPTFVDAIAGLGQVAYERGDLAEAHQHFAKATDLARQQLGGSWPVGLDFNVARDRSFLRAIHGRGLVAYRRGEPKPAQEWFTLEQQLDRGDHQGSRFLLARIKRGQAWG